MILTVVGHLTIDNIQLGSLSYITLGGSASYSSLMIRNMGSEVNLLTKYGKDMPKEHILKLLENQIRIPKNSISNNSYTTKFKIVLKKNERKIFLRSRCEDLNYSSDIKGNGAIISPVAGEVNSETIKKVRANHDIVFLDPQGFIREFGMYGNCFYKKLNINILKYSDIIKLDEVEAYWVTGKKDPVQVLKQLKTLGLKISIFTMGAKGIFLYCDKGLFDIPIIKKKRLLDTTGVGDIFAGAFTTKFIQNRDPVWAGCIAVAASSVGIDKIGLYKVPNKEIVIKNAKEIFGRVKQIEKI